MEKLEPTGIEALVCQDIAGRQALGLRKYGLSVAANPLTHREWLEHAYLECLDMAIYLRRAMEEIQPVHALAGAATGDGALGTMRPTTEGGEA